MNPKFECYLHCSLRFLSQITTDSLTCNRCGLCGTIAIRFLCVWVYLVNLTVRCLSFVCRPPISTTFQSLLPLHPPALSTSCLLSCFSPIQMELDSCRFCGLDLVLPWTNFPPPGYPWRSLATPVILPPYSSLWVKRSVPADFLDLLPARYVSSVHRQLTSQLGSQR